MAGLKRTHDIKKSSSKKLRSLGANIKNDLDATSQRYIPSCIALTGAVLQVTGALFDSVARSGDAAPGVSSSVLYTDTASALLA